MAFVTGEPFHVDGGGHHHMRLSFASAEEQDITEGIRRIGNAMQRLLQRRTGHEGHDQLHVERLSMI